ncbi:MAG: hypothetical protein ACTSWW_07500 [Promethearchaeota archaeon]
MGYFFRAFDGHCNQHYAEYLLCVFNDGKYLGIRDFCIVFCWVIRPGIYGEKKELEEGRKGSKKKVIPEELLSKIAV